MNQARIIILIGILSILPSRKTCGQDENEIVRAKTPNRLLNDQDQRSNQLSQSLLGPYRNLFYSNDLDDKDRRIRFFAIRIKGDLSDYDKIEEKIAEGSRIVDWNSFCLVHSGVVNREMIRKDESLLVGVHCPTCNDYHWVAIGSRKAFYKRSQDETYEIRTNGLGNRINTDLIKGWNQKKFYRFNKFLSTFKEFIVSLNTLRELQFRPFWNQFVNIIRDVWIAPIEEGGYHLERFVHNSTPCGIEVGAGITREGDFAFSFNAVNYASVSMIGDYVNKPSGGIDQLFLPYAEMIHYYAIVISDPNLICNKLNEHRLYTLGKLSANYAAETIRLQGLSLKDVTSLKRQRLSHDKIIVLGVYNSTKGENQWISFYRSKNGSMTYQTNIFNFTAPPKPDSWCGFQTGGFVIELFTSVQQNGDFEYMFLNPR